MTSPYGQTNWQQGPQGYGQAPHGYGQQGPMVPHPHQGSGYAQQQTPYGAPHVPSSGGSEGLLWIIAGTGIVSSVLVSLVGSQINASSWGVMQTISALSGLLGMAGCAAAGIALGSMLRRGGNAGAAMLWGGVAAALGLLVVAVLGFAFDPTAEGFSFSSTRFAVSNIVAALARLVMDTGLVLLVFGIWARAQR